MFATQELYAYASTVRMKFLEKLGSLPWEFVVKNREASYYSMRNIMLHIIDNEDWIVNWVISNRSTEYQRRKSDEYTSFETVKEHLEEVEAKTKAYLEHADSTELDRRVKFALTSGARFSTFRLKNHSSNHSPGNFTIWGN